MPERDPFDSADNLEGKVDCIRTIQICPSRFRLESYGLELELMQIRNQP